MTDLESVSGLARSLASELGAAELVISAMKDRCGALHNVFNVLMSQFLVGVEVHEDAPGVQGQEL